MSGNYSPHKYNLKVLPLATKEQLKTERDKCFITSSAVGNIVGYGHTPIKEQVKRSMAWMLNNHCGLKINLVESTSDFAQDLMDYGNAREPIILTKLRLLANEHRKDTLELIHGPRDKSPTDYPLSKTFASETNTPFIHYQNRIHIENENSIMRKIYLEREIISMLEVNYPGSPSVNTCYHSIASALCSFLVGSSPDDIMVVGRFIRSDESDIYNYLDYVSEGVGPKNRLVTDPIIIEVKARKNFGNYDDIPNGHIMQLLTTSMVTGIKDYFYAVEYAGPNGRRDLNVTPFEIPTPRTSPSSAYHSISGFIATLITIYYLVILKHSIKFHNMHFKAFDNKRCILPMTVESFDAVCSDADKEWKVAKKEIIDYYLGELQSVSVSMEGWSNSNPKGCYKNKPLKKMDDIMYLLKQACSRDTNNSKYLCPRDRRKDGPDDMCCSYSTTWVSDECDSISESSKSPL